MDGGLRRLDDFACQAADLILRDRCRRRIVGGGWVVGHVDGFEEDGDALNGFVAYGTLFGGELEGVGDFVGEVLGGQGL